MDAGSGQSRCSSSASRRCCEERAHGLPLPPLRSLMHASPDAPRVVAFLTRVARRRMWLGALEGTACGLLIAIVLMVATTIGRTSAWSALAVAALMATIGAVAGLLLARRPRPSTAALVERRAPQCRNIVITASEIIAT